MPSTSPIRSRVRFAGFTFDPFNARLLHEDEVIPMRPKTVALLVELTRRAGDLVGKDELMAAVWPEAMVSDSVLAGAVQELRRILGDDPRQPRVIETVHRRGYRFIARTEQAPEASGEARERARVLAEPAIIGRHAEIELLSGWLDKALGGTSVVGFVVGEAGIGKTTLVRAFCERAASQRPGLQIGIGHGIEWTSQTEASVDPYLPILEALGRACTGPGSEKMVATMARYAPSWLALLPGVHVDRQHASPQVTTRERLALELTGFLDALANPLLLVLEDLHWSDASTIDMVTAVARSSLRAKLLLLATYRAAGAAARGHPVRAAHQTLSARRSCVDVWLSPFNADDVQRCIEKRWPGIAMAANRVLAGVVLKRTDGNPLFVTSVVDQLDGERLASADATRLAGEAAQLEIGIPAGLRQVIEAEIARLRRDDRRLLEAGSLCGVRFPAEAAAAVVGIDVVETETRLDALANAGTVLRSSGEEIWPDGTIATMYEFPHALHGDVLRGSVSAAGRRAGHRLVAQRLHAAWRNREAEVAAELVFHFHAAGAADEAVPHVERAASAASRLGANREAVGFLERGIAALQALPADAERTRTAVRLSISLGQVLQAPDGFFALEAEAAYARALALAETLDNPSETIVPLLALTSVHVAQARLADASNDASRATALLERFPTDELRYLADVIIAQVHYHLAEFPEAHRMLERALAFAASQTIATFFNFQIHALNYDSLTLMHLGRPDAARRRLREAMSAARDTGVPFNRASAAGFACWAAILVRDRASLELASVEAETIGREYGFGFPAGAGKFARGLLRHMSAPDLDDGVRTMTEAMRLFEQNGYTVVLPSLMAVVADAHLAKGDAAPARTLVAEARALTSRSGDGRYRAELARIEGEADLVAGDARLARSGFEEAKAIAHSLHQKWHELRASLALAKLLLRGGDAAGARHVLEPVVGGIDEGEDLEEFREARALLDGLLPASSSR